MDIPLEDLQPATFAGVQGRGLVLVDDRFTPLSGVFLCGELPSGVQPEALPAARYILYAPYRGQVRLPDGTMSEDGAKCVVRTITRTEAGEWRLDLGPHQDFDFTVEGLIRLLEDMPLDAPVIAEAHDQMEYPIGVSLAADGKVIIRTGEGACYWQYPGLPIRTL